MGFQKLASMLREAFGPDQSGPTGSDDREESIRLATAALLLEIAYADSSMSREEESRLVDHLRASFRFDEKEARELMEAADELRSETIDHFSMTNLLRQNLTLDDRIEIVKTMWRMVYLDGQLHQYENYLVRKLADLLGLEHHVMIEAKLAVQGE